MVAVCESESPFHGTTGMVKRLADVALASAALVLTAPLMLAVALVIKLLSPGPVLFKQRRYGLDGREIYVWKFRSMRVMEDGAQLRQATQGDDRVTPFGRFIRRTSLDELPQFFNVLPRRIEYDLDYLRNWSLKLDLQIVVRTALTVLRDPKAY